MFDPDEAILSYLLHRAACEEGSIGRIAKSAGSHAYVHARHLGHEPAKVRCDEVSQRVRDLLAFKGSV